MAVTISVDDAYQSMISPKNLRVAVQAVLDVEGVEGDVTILITDDETVADLNRRFLHKEGATDVLSFPVRGEADNFILPPDLEMTPYLGDIIIALPYTQRQARRLHRSLMEELTLLVVHGALHLLGYDHATPSEKREMWARQDAILAGLPPSD